ncbi:unnamed protein product [Mucor circinelloides]|uniref:Uncharacterized protein n=1 Tax=Mucor circinelloides f. circinelloides (strain 1006PhL) TaxID=1220926 RepID=S2JQ84_MUCC1|nr:hypothetical protein HMPREF1544_00759 [Mucor circinelloides 1006PhL]KAG1095672.1 hypothetical protein G6F42_018509 [Rhizopus arrhizus]
MTQHQLSQTIVDQIKDAGYQCWIQIYSPLFWILSVLINHWRLQENNKAIITENFSYSNIVPSSRKPVSKLKNSPSPTPPRIVISPSSLQHQQQRHLSNKQPSTISKKKAVAASTLLPSKPKSSFSTPTSNTKRKQTSSIFSSWKQKHPHHHSHNRPLLQHQPSRTSFLRRLSSSSSSTSSGDTTRSEPSSPSILKSFSWKLKRQHSDSSLETGHPTAAASSAASSSSSKQPRISLSHFKKKAAVL